MTVDDANSEQWKILDWWMAPAEFFDRPIRALVSSSYEWPDAVRRAYALCWPIAMPARCVAIVVLLIVFLALALIGHTLGCLNLVYRGLRSPWQ